ncbi:pollen-specific leucine-rich repeat extensin-like protein 1 [Penaeus chinensis]|uniref:pollen-specific leucine-rich repeat extensin-like protein 1 n=1 Tax=Penaeus chinensis TaxID=139456 RepID=UPI001FB763D6|nr:pollen-specific leucine-rich repeat extensin-like protein 1 [Penaeus chinensis]
MTAVLIGNYTEVPCMLSIHSLATTTHSLATTTHSLATTNHPLGTTNHPLATTTHSLGTTTHPPCNHNPSSPGNHNPPPGNHNPSPGNHNPPPGNHNPPPGNHNPPPGNHNPPPGNHKSPPGNHNPPPGNHNPPPGNHKPPPGNHKPPNPTPGSPLSSSSASSSSAVTLTTAEATMIPSAVQSYQYSQILDYKRINNLATESLNWKILKFRQSSCSMSPPLPSATMPPPLRARPPHNHQEAPLSLPGHFSEHHDVFAAASSAPHLPPPEHSATPNHSGGAALRSSGCSSYPKESQPTVRLEGEASISSSEFARPTVRGAARAGPAALRTTSATSPATSSPPGVGHNGIGNTRSKTGVRLRRVRSLVGATPGAALSLMMMVLGLIMMLESLQAPPAKNPGSKNRC